MVLPIRHLEVQVNGTSVHVPLVPQDLRKSHVTNVQVASYSYGSVR